MKSVVNYFRTAPVASYFVLAATFTWAILGLAVLEANGVSTLALPVTLLITVATMGPAAAALIVVRAESGRSGVRGLLAQARLWRVKRTWYLIALAGPALVMTAAFLLWRLIGGPSLPAPGLNAWMSVPILAAVLLIPALFEEVGWRGLALPRLQERYGSLTASLIIGVAWAVWHLPIWFIPEAGFSTLPFPVFVAFTTALSVLFTWLYNGTGGSVLLPALAHAAINATPLPWNTAVSLLPEGERGPHVQIPVTVVLVVVAALLAWRLRPNRVDSATSSRAATGPLMLIVMAVLLVSCATTPAPSSSTSGLPSTTTTALSSTTAQQTTSTTAPEGPAVALIPTAGAMSENWIRVFVIPYGVSPQTLGTAPGGDGGSLDIGPNYGTQTADGVWWFLDAAKQRIARFSPDGEYLDEILLPPQLLADGRYFQYQVPKALDDGSVLAVRFDELGTQLLSIGGDGSLDSRHLPGFFAPRVSDGHLLYMSSPDGEMVQFHPGDGDLGPVEWLRTRQGSRFMVTIEDDTIVVTLPEIGIQQRIPMRWADNPQSPVHAGLQADTGTDGSIFIFLYGAPDVSQSTQVTGFLTISPDGKASMTEGTLDPFSSADPGSPSHLGVRPGTSEPWLMFVLDDGVHVYKRTAK